MGMICSRDEFSIKGHELKAEQQDTENQNILASKAKAPSTMKNKKIIQTDEPVVLPTIDLPDFPSAENENNQEISSNLNQRNERDSLVSINEEGSNMTERVEQVKVNFKILKFWKMPKFYQSVTCLIKLNDDLIASSSREEIMIWNYKNVELHMILSAHHSHVITLIKLDDNIIASGSINGSIDMWNYKTGKLQKSLRVGSETFNSVCTLLKLDDTTIATGENNFKIHIWNFQTENLIMTLEGHQGPVYSLIYLDENTFASGSKDGTIKIWNNKSYDIVRSLSLHGYNFNTLLKLDDDTLACGSENNVIFILNYKTSEVLRYLTDVASQTIKSKSDLTTSSNASEIQTKKETLKRQTSDVIKFCGEVDYIQSIIKFDGNTIASGSKHGSIMIWNYKTGVLLQTLRGHYVIVNTLIKLDDNSIASGSDDTSIRIWIMKKN